MRSPRLAGRAPLLLLAALLTGCLKEPPAMETTPPADPVPVVDAPLHLEAEPVGGEAGMGRLLALCTRLQRAHDLRQTPLCLERFTSNLGVGGYKDGETQVSRDQAQGRVLTLQARSALELGKTARALELAQQAGKKLKGAPRTEAVLLEAIAQARSGQRFEAERLLALLQEGKGDMPHLEMAVIHLALGDAFKARDLLDKALTTGTGRPDSLALPTDPAAWARLDLENPGTARERLPVAILATRLLLETGSLEAAAPRADALLTHPRLAGMPSVRALLLHDRGRIAQQQGDAKQARRLLQEAATAIESRRLPLDPLAGSVALVADRERIHTDLVALLVAEGEYVEAFSWAERGKRLALTELLSERQLFSGGPQLQTPLPNAILEELREAELDAAIQNPRRTPEQQTALEERIRAIRARIQEAHPPWGAFALASDAQTDRILGQLPPEERMVLFYGTGEELFAFVAGRTQVWATPLDGKGLEASVEALRRGLAKPQGEEYKKVAYDLYRRLIAPLEERFKEATGLTLVPHGVLNRLPFAALHDGKAFFGDRFALRALPLAGALTPLNNRQAGRNQGLLILSDPASPSNREGFPHAQNEQQAITRFRNPVRALTRQEATETLFKHYARDFGAIHLTGLAHFQAADPLQSGLLLAKDGENDGLVSVDELYGLHLGAEVVTLHGSRFETGQERSDVGVAALSQGLLYAGSDALLLPLWRSDGWSTAALMEQFYRNLKLQQDRRTALRNAQKALRHNGYDHPHYWAGFLLTGGMDNLLPDVPPTPGMRKVESAPRPFQPQPMPPAAELAPSLPRAQVVAQAEEPARPAAPKTEPVPPPPGKDAGAPPPTGETSAAASAPAKGGEPPAMEPPAPATPEETTAPAPPEASAATAEKPSEPASGSGMWSWLGNLFGGRDAEAATAAPSEAAPPAAAQAAPAPTEPPPAPEEPPKPAAPEEKTPPPAPVREVAPSPPPPTEAPKEASREEAKGASKEPPPEPPKPTAPKQEEKKPAAAAPAPAAPTLLSASPGGSVAKAPLPKGLSSAAQRAGLGSIHYIHMGSYTSDDSLGKAADWIRAKGLNVEVQEVMIKRQWYKRLLVGPFREATAVEQAVAQLKENGEGVVPEVVPPLTPPKPTPKTPEPPAKAEEKPAPKPQAAPKEAPPKAEIPKTEATKAVPPHDSTPTADAPKADAPKEAPPSADTPTADAPKADAPTAGTPKADATKADDSKADAAKTTPSPAATVSDDEPETLPASAIPESQAYYVQMGAYANKEGASRPIRFIQSRDLAYKLVPTQGQTRTLYRLLVGPYADPIAALSALQILEEMEDGATPFLVSPPDPPAPPKAAAPAKSKAAAADRKKAVRP